VGGKGVNAVVVDAVSVRSNFIYFSSSPSYFLSFFAYICVFPSYFAGAFPFVWREFGGELTKRKINIGKPIDGGRMPRSSPEVVAAVDVAVAVAAAAAVATLGAAAVATAACGPFSSRVSVRCTFR